MIDQIRISTVMSQFSAFFYLHRRNRLVQKEKNTYQNRKYELN